MSNVEALLNTDPAGGPATAATKYRGVPEGYVAPGYASDQSTLFDRPEVAPRYVYGDEFTPGIGNGPDAIAEMQQDLMAAGLIPKGTQFRIGVWDSVTSTAYGKALDFANQQGMEAGQAVETLINSPVYGDDAAGGKNQSLQYELPNRDDVKVMAKKIGRNQLGRNVDDDFAERVATAYEAEVMKSQQQQFQNAAIDGAKNYEAPNFETFAAQQLRAENPGEAQAHDYANVYGQFTDLISQSAAQSRAGGN